MGKRTDYMVKFYLKDLQLDKFDKHCKWLHNNELPQRDTYCSDCKTLILNNSTLNTWICYNCFRTFTKKEIIELDPNSKNCKYCKRKIMWYAEYCGDCTNRIYKLGDYFIQKIRLISTKTDNIRESICNYKWSYYQFDHKELQLKEINRTINSLKSLRKSIKKVDIYLDKVFIKEKKGSVRWERKRNNNIKFGIKILKKEKERENKNKKEVK